MPLSRVSMKLALTDLHIVCIHCKLTWISLQDVGEEDFSDLPILMKNTPMFEQQTTRHAMLSSHGNISMDLLFKGDTMLVASKTSRFRVFQLCSLPVTETFR